jgi:hypothetical protein
LPIPNIPNCGFEIILVIDVSLTSALGPPVFALGPMARTLQFVQLSCAPCLELVPYVFRMAVCGNDDVHVIAPTVYLEQLPAADLAMIINGFFNESALLLIKFAGWFCHPPPSLILARRIWQLMALATPDPAARVAR